MKSNYRILSRLMAMSWEIQKNKNVSRSKALVSAWAIVQNANITILYVVDKYSKKSISHIKQINPANLQLTLTA